MELKVSDNVSESLVLMGIGCHLHKITRNFKLNYIEDRTYSIVFDSKKEEMVAHLGGFPPHLEKIITIKH